MISTRGRYALRVMLDLAENATDKYIRLDEIALRQGISEKYLEGIMSALARGGLVRGVRGKGGGYKLNRSPTEYTVGEILRLTEGSLSSVACLKEGATACEKRTACKTVRVWQGLNAVVNEYLDGITLAELSERT